MNVSPFFEKHHHWMAALAAAAVYGSCIRWRPTNDSATIELLASVITISSIMVGFIAAAKAIVLSSNESNVIKFLKESGHYTTIIDFSITAVKWSIVLAIVSAFGLLLHPPDGHRWHLVGCIVWVFLCVGSALACYRVFHIFGKLLKRL